MGTTVKWLGKALRGLRSFAYEQEGGRPRVGLALGGGFARGIAHIGVLQTFEEYEIPIDCIAGTSVGALIATAYASGCPLSFMAEQGSHTRFSDFGRWKLSRRGMATNDRLEDFLHKFTPARTFEEMKIPLAIVAVDILTGESVHFKTGEIGPALRASCAYPGLFIPVDYEGRCLVDGFLTETVPTPAAREMGGDIVVAVHLEPGLLKTQPKNSIEVISRSFSIIQTRASDSWRREADVLIEPNVHHVMWDEFSKTPELVESGRRAAREMVPKIKALLEGKAQLKRRMRAQKHPKRAAD
ncbi:MAG TPA: patatin-like phospholipase family protein [Candidatus Micrarchaeaceae archaeon]|nr:patatin-like phospholipase family protein [Candidatus Micrarchaeaceae archaeon]